MARTVMAIAEFLGYLVLWFFIGGAMAIGLRILGLD